MTVTYIKWRDATHGIAEAAPADMGLAELEEIGWLVREDDESVSISMEYQVEANTTRLWLTVPKANILERKDRDLDKVFPRRKRRA